MIYERLRGQYPTVTIDGWWGLDDPFARMIGSVLVQNTTWSNASKALTRMQGEEMLAADILARQTPEKLIPVIHSAGFQQRKAETIIRLSAWLVDLGGIDKAASTALETEVLRRQLLSIKGIGEETADTILAYVFLRPAISGDAYARRLHERLTGERGTYGPIRSAMMAQLHTPDELGLLHALIVEHGKETCRKRSPQCSTCSLQPFCQHAHVSADQERTGA
ncbi:endonuclease III domain-containing protein [Brevibacillus migulae]|uniref:endonuclease III domain-containing protein n=1 Tax=Brevibacillus migulae TaxID=1644114 RepID=UPI001F1E1C24|nr:hypothetical protein [Brevibacillus migulae]